MAAYIWIHQNARVIFAICRECVCVFVVIALATFVKRLFFSGFCSWSLFLPVSARIVHWTLTQISSHSPVGFRFYTQVLFFLAHSLILLFFLLLLLLLCVFALYKWFCDPDLATCCQPSHWITAQCIAMQNEEVWKTTEHMHTSCAEHTSDNSCFHEKVEIKWDLYATADRRYHRPKH